MNTLLVLLDKTDLFNQDKGFIITKKDFDLLESRVDLGFVYQIKSYQDEEFYSIPIIFYPYSPSDSEIFEDIEKIAMLTDRNKFLVKTNKYKEHILVEAEGNKLRKDNTYWRSNYEALNKRNSDIGGRIQEIENIFKSRQ